jgi:hypothetical protein
MGVAADCERTVQEAVDGLKGLDVIISNAVRLANRTLYLRASSDYLSGLDEIHEIWRS